MCSAIPVERSHGRNDESFCDRLCCGLRGDQVSAVRLGEAELTPGCPPHNANYADGRPRSDDGTVAHVGVCNPMSSAHRASTDIRRGRRQQHQNPGPSFGRKTKEGREKYSAYQQLQSTHCVPMRCVTSSPSGRDKIVGRVSQRDLRGGPPISEHARLSRLYRDG